MSDYDFNYQGGYITIQKKTFRMSSIDAFWFEENTLVLIIRGNALRLTVDPERVEYIAVQLDNMCNSREID